jgi:hypothetical protein
MARPAFGGKGVQQKEEEKKEDQPVKKSPSGKTLPQLVSVDLNLDSLKGFLEEIQEVINEHARTLASHQSEIQKKANEKTVSNYY